MSDNFTLDQVGEAINRAAEDIAEAAGLPETGTVDALTLLIVTTMGYLENPSATLSEVVDRGYAIDMSDYNEIYPYAKTDPEYDAEEKQTLEEEVWITRLDVVIERITGRDPRDEYGYRRVAGA